MSRIDSKNTDLWRCRRFGQVIAVIAGPLVEGKAEWGFVIKRKTGAPPICSGRSPGWSHADACAAAAMQAELWADGPPTTAADILFAADMHGQLEIEQARRKKK
jgi:hypothetical protein